MTNSAVGPGPAQHDDEVRAWGVGPGAPAEAELESNAGAPEAARTAAASHGATPKTRRAVANHDSAMAANAVRHLGDGDQGK